MAQLTPTLALHVGQKNSARYDTLLSIAWRHFRKHRPALAGVAVLALLIFSAIAVPIITNYDATKTRVVEKYQAPSLQHPMGTDGLGRDVFIRSMDGGRISLLIGLTAMLLAVVIGTSVGALAGFYGGGVDNLLMRVADIMLTLPTLFVAILLTQLLRAGVIPFLSSGFVPIVLVIGATSWMSVSRLVRAAFLSIKEQEYIQAARAAGARNWRIILRHILPNALSPIIVAATLRVGAAIITESGLSYLGFGVQPPTPTWGNMLRNAQSEMDYAAWTAIFPGLFIFLTVIAVNYIGDGLRDALDPHHVE